MPRRSSQGSKAYHLEWASTKLLLQRRHGRGNRSSGVRDGSPLLLLLGAPLILLLVLSRGGIARSLDEDGLAIHEGRAAAEDFEHVDDRLQLRVNCWPDAETGGGRGRISAQDA